MDRDPICPANGSPHIFAVRAWRALVRKPRAKVDFDNLSHGFTPCEKHLVKIRLTDIDHEGNGNYWKDVGGLIGRHLTSRNSTVLCLRKQFSRALDRHLRFPEIK